MIPAAFDYTAPASVDEALRQLAEHGDDAKIMAGGQSLLPLMKMRLAAPEFVIDLGKVTDLDRIRTDGDRLVLGSRVTHHQVETDPLVAEHVPLLAQAARTIADPQVRHRGTLGGSLAHADPAADLPNVARTLDAEMVIAGGSGSRTVPAADFFVDYFTTAIGDDEILTQIRFPVMAGWGSRYEKFAPLAQAWSIVAVAAAVRVEGDRIAEARLGLTNMGTTPYRADAAERALTGVALDQTAVDQAVAGIADDAEPATDIHGSAEYRRHLARVLARRAVLAAAGR